jgi:hypothetical protein
MAVGIGPVVRGALAGLVVALLTLALLLRGLFALIEPGASELAQAVSGALVVFAAAAVGGAAGAWQAAMAGAPSRRTIVFAGAAGLAAVGGLSSAVMAVLQSVEPIQAVLEVAMIVAGAGAGAWAFPRLTLAVVALRGQRGQTSAEYLGVLVVVGAIVAALVVVGPRIAEAISNTVDSIAGGGDDRTSVEADPAGRGEGALPDGDGRPADDPVLDPAGIPGVDYPVPGRRDSDGDGLSDGEEIALGTRPDVPDSDGDGILDGQEYEQGTDPTRGVAPLTDENRFKPWERLGVSEEEWREFEDAVLEEANPGGWEGVLFGPSVWGVTLDENGQLAFIEIQEAGVGGGVVKGLARLLGASGGRTVSQVASSAAARVPGPLRSTLARVGVVPGARAVPRPPAPPSRPGSALGALDDLGRPTGASATVSREMLGTGTRTSRAIRPPGFRGDPAGHARGHLIARQLGGSGTDARNLVTLFQRPANSPVMRGFETAVRRAVERGEVVRYNAQPIYRGAEEIPRAVTLTARGNRGFRLDVTILNRGG